MKELSIFVDESGDFGVYDYHAPFYIISMVLHDQAVNIVDDLKILENLVILDGQSIVFILDR